MSLCFFKLSVYVSVSSYDAGGFVFSVQSVVRSELIGEVLKNWRR